MLDRRTVAPVLVLLSAAAVALPAAPPRPAGAAGAQDWAAQDSGGQGAQDPVAAEVATLVGRLVASLGGQQRVESLEGFDFTLTDVVIEPPAEEGGEPVERALDPIGVSLGINPVDRRVRLVEQLPFDGETVELVRIAANDGVRVTIDGELRDTERLALEGRARAAELLLVLDLSLGLALGQLTATPDQERTRDGVAYDCLEVRFPEGRGVADPFRLYLDQETGLVRRADQFDSATLRRRATILFDDLAEVEGVRLPRRIVFLDRDRTPLRRWELSEVVADPEWPEGHFAVR